MPQQSSRQNVSDRRIALVINGARGRMGAMIARLAADDARFEIIALRDIDAPSLDARSTVDVIIDFSSEAGCLDAIALAKARGAALVCGVTGLSSAAIDALHDAASSIPALHAPNTSLGVAVMAHLAAEAARLLGEDYHIDIIEMHHTQKKDAPSGTALRLAKAMRERGGASGRLGAERIHAIRAGDIVGEHTIQFAGPGERLTLTHHASSRELFARGALRAAAFLARKPPGRYSIEQALGIE